MDTSHKIELSDSAVLFFTFPVGREQIEHLDLKPGIVAQVFSNGQCIVGEIVDIRDDDQQSPQGSKIVTARHIVSYEP